MSNKVKVLFYLNLFLTFLCQSKAQPRIVNGYEAYEGQFPYMAFLVVNESFHCSASIIQSHWILTAGHCITNQDTFNAMRIHVGRTQLFKKGGQYFKPEIVFTKYTGPHNLGQDIAIIRIQGTIQFDQYTRPVPLPNPDYQPLQNVGLWGSVSGWGSLNYGTEAPNNLLYVNFEIRRNEDCSGYVMTNEMICGISPQANICSGDSGSPWVTYGVQIGISSTTHEFCQASAPVIFVNVAPFVPWIKEQLVNYNDYLGY